jgi:shikimate dehydrogenase
MSSKHLNINGETKVSGLIGKSISYSLSPLIHNTAITQMGLNQVYVPFDVPDRKTLTNMLDAMAGIGAVGFNVTQPWKSIVAEIIGGSPQNPVNTITLENGKWTGQSTDAEGFVRGLERIGRKLGDFKSVILLGAGGAALSLMKRFKLEGLQNVAVLARRSQDIASQLTASGYGQKDNTHVKVSELNLANLTLEIKNAPDALLVQATSAPVHGEMMNELVPALDRFSGTFVDLVYGQPSALFHRSLSMGLPTQDGEAMLIEQARLSQEIWWGRSASWEILAAALRDFKKRKQL